MPKITVSKNKPNGKTNIDCIDFDFDTREQAEIVANVLKTVGLNVAWENQNKQKSRVCLIVSYNKKPDDKDWVIMESKSSGKLEDLF